MKTFFIALILGIFIGCLAMTYHYAPDTFDGIAPQTKANSEELKDDLKDSPSETISKKAEETIEKAHDAIEEPAQEIAEKSENWAKSIKDKGADALESTRDLTIGTTIRSKFKLDREIDSSAISIDIKDGRVTLSGTVPSKEIKQRVISLAIDTKWVKEVESNLKIR
tara:strand:- start:238 stop:738 length:501 start_codon:yes stop_codon:yes gene_type:complete